MDKKKKIIVTVGVLFIGIALIAGMVIWAIQDNSPKSPDDKWEWFPTINESGNRTTASGISTFAKDGCYTWWTNALALRHVGEKDQTYLSYVDEQGRMSLASYNHITAQYEYFTLAEYEKDDHNSAALTILPNGKVLAVYARHGADKNIRWRISDKVEDITSFCDEKTITTSNNVTYIQIHRISEDEYRIFYRLASSHWGTRIYNWVKNTWTDEQKWLTEEKGKQYYLWIQEDKEEGKLNMFMTGHPANGPDQNIRYGYFDKDGNICTTGGKFLANLYDEYDEVLSPRDFDIVFAPEKGYSTRLYDVSYMGDKIGVLFGNMVDGTESDYYYSYYDDVKKEWVNQIVCQSGQAAVVGNRYFGGLSFDKQDMQTVYVSRREGGLFRIEKWKTSDYGASWDSIELLDEGEKRSEILMRPIIPYNAHEDIEVIFIKGAYPTYLDYNTDLVFYAP